MCLHKFILFVVKVWSCVSYFIRRQVREVIHYQTVKYPVRTISQMYRLSIVKRKYLVLDLDETLIHSHHEGVRPLLHLKSPYYPPDLVLKVVIERHPVMFFVHKRPHVDFFLSVVSQWYELVIFTASMEIYGAAISDALDRNRKSLKRRFYRQHCSLEYGSYTKDLSTVTDDLSSVFIIDNSPGAYRGYPDNAIPIESWYSDPNDLGLLNLLPLLDALRFVNDVRSVLSRNLHLEHRRAGSMCNSNSS